MTKTTKKHFELFKIECKKWVDKLELNSWTITYLWENLDRKGFDIACNSGENNYTAKIWFDTEFDKENIGDENISNIIKDSAKHEVIHIFLKRLTINSRARFLAEHEVTEAEEELVRKLENLL